MPKESPKKTAARLSDRDKAVLSVGKDAWETHAGPNGEYMAIHVCDGPHGVRLQKGGEIDIAAKAKATCFPTACSMASTWDRGLIRKIGEALGDECRALGVHILLGPGANIKRTPLGGRNFEYYSEDPFQAGEIGSTLVDGLQSKGVGACLKHFACNNQEWERMTASSDVDERTLREIYLSVFERIVKQSRPLSLMCAYNAINGVLCSENKRLLTDILRKEWGYGGFVMSDWGAVNDRAVSLAAGLDIEMPGGNPASPEKVLKAIKKKELPAGALNDTAERIIGAAHWLEENWKPLDSIDAEGHHKLARQAAAEGAVLLKNDGELLPIDPNRKGKLAVIGLFAQKPRYQGSGSSKIDPLFLDIPLEELHKTAPLLEIVYEPGLAPGHRSDPALKDRAAAAASQCDTAVIFAGLPDSHESEGFDRTELGLPSPYEELILAVASRQPRTIVVLMNGSPVSGGDWIDAVPSVLELWLGGQAVGGAAADILFGRVNPSGKLPETIPARIEDTPAFLNTPGDSGHAVYGEGQFVGYRWYDKRDITPLFPFGHGLSYTQFEYTDLKILENNTAKNGDVRISVTLKNTGTRQGAEVVQIYLKPPAGTKIRPAQYLVHFDRLELAPGESRTAEFLLPERDFACWDTEAGRYLPEPGEYVIEAASSSRDIRLTLPVMADFPVPPFRFTRMTPLKVWVSDPRGRKALKPVLDSEFGALLEKKDPDGPSDFDVIGEVPIFKLTALSGGKMTEEAVEYFIAVANGENALIKGIKAGVAQAGK
jgi:beta-glucosidase